MPGSDDDLWATFDATAGPDTLEKPAPKSRNRKNAPRPKRANSDGIIGDVGGPFLLAKLLTPRLEGRYAHVEGLGWLMYDETKWASVKDATVLQEVEPCLDEEARALMDDGWKFNDVVDAVRAMSSPSASNHALKLCSGAPGISREAKEFDAPPAEGKPYLVPCANGVTAELHRDGSVKFRPTRPADRNTRVAAAYDPEATAPRTLEAFARYQPDESVRQYILSMNAQGLAGVGPHKFTVHVGGSQDTDASGAPRGGNGKSTIMTATAWAAGEYAVSLPVEVLLKRRGAGTNREAYRSELAQLRGARLVFTSEPPAGSRLDAEFVNYLTGGEPITAREVREKKIEFRLKAYFSMTANARPNWEANGGMERRYVEISWAYQIPEDEMRESFMDELASESSGFLNVILAHWTGDGVVEVPASIKAMTTDGKAKASLAGPFRNEVVVPAEGCNVSSSLMYEAYRAWSKSQGLQPVSLTKFGTELARVGVSKKHTSHGNVWTDVAIDEDFRSTMEGAGRAIGGGYAPF